MKTLRKQMIQQMQLKGYSPNTIGLYIKSIARIASYYNTPADLLSVNQIRDFLHLFITEKKLSKSWLNINISAIKLLFCEVLKRDWSILDIPRPRRDKRLPVVFSKDEVALIINSKVNLKHRALLMVTYSAGLRLSEVCHLKVSDIDSKRKLILVSNGKGNKDRYTILSSVALNTLRIYYQLYKPKEWLFEGIKGGAISIRTAQNVFKQALRKSKISKKVGIHCLRHSFATHLLEQGVSLPLIQQMMGHRSIRTTSRYFHVQQYSIQGVKSPLDSLPL